MADQKPITLGQLRPGAVFETVSGTYSGTRAVKSEYRYSNEPNCQCQCVLLGGGEYAHFKKKNDTLVRELQVGPFEGIPIKHASVNMLLSELRRRSEYLSEYSEIGLDELWADE